MRTMLDIILLFALIALVGSLQGCGGLALQPDYSEMSAKQIKALTADKTVGVWCGSIGSYGKGVYVSSDIASGTAAKNARGVKVDGSTCNVEINETPVVKP